MSFGKRGVVTTQAAGGRTSSFTTPRRAAAVNVTAPATHFTAKYNLQFSWLGLCGFWFAGRTFYNEVLYPPSLGLDVNPELALITNWAAIIIGLIVGGFSLWHGVHGSPALILDDDGVTAYNLYGRSHVTWQDIEHLTFQDAKYYGLTLEIRSKQKWFGIIPRGVCYTPKLADKSIEDVVTALRLRRPDLSWSGGV